MKNKNSPLLLDTHVLLWVLLKPSEISTEMKHRIEKAQANHQLLLASISLWEIAMLQLKKRLDVYAPIKDFLQAIVTIEGLTIKDISADVAAESVALVDHFHGDPADRLIVATARVHGATLVTRDKKILAWAQLGNIRSLEA